MPPFTGNNAIIHTYAYGSYVASMIVMTQLAIYTSMQLRIYSYTLAYIHA